MKKTIQQYDVIATMTVRHRQHKQQEQEQCKTTIQTTIRVAHLLVVDVDDVAPAAAAAATRVHLNSGHIRHTKNNLENETRTMDHYNPQSQP